MSKPCGVYLATPMTGYDKAQMIEESKRACYILESFGLKPWSPVLHENIQGQGKLENSKTDLDWKWEKLDKPALNKCFVFLNLHGDSKSFGCEREHGRHRFSEWQPVVIVSPKHCAGYHSIAEYEDDVIVPTVEAAAFVIRERWGTWFKRFVWKVKIMRHLPWWIIRQIRRFTQ